MRIYFYYLNQLVLIGLFLYMAYLPTVLIDFFSWGDSRRDGLYLLVLPFFVLPLIVIFSLVKYWIVKRMLLSKSLKLAFILPLAVGLLSTFLAAVASSNEGMLSATLAAFLMALILIVETILFMMKISFFSETRSQKSPHS